MKPIVFSFIITLVYYKNVKFQNFYLSFGYMYNNLQTLYLHGTNLQVYKLDNILFHFDS